MIAFIDEHRVLPGVEPICRVLPIARSTYHAHAARRADPGKLPARARRDITLRSEIRRVYEENFRVYGVRKVWRQLLREGIALARCILGLMRRMGLQGVVRGQRVRTTSGNAAASSTTVIAVCRTSRSSTPSAWPRRASSRRSAASAT